jgi:hypothetical protein
MPQRLWIWIKSRLTIFHQALPLTAIALFCLLVSKAPAAQTISVFPESDYDAYIIYQNLAIFWFFLIGLIVIIRMKLREIERTQKMGLHQEDEKAPRLS